MNNKKKELKKEYQHTHPPMGIYQIRNLVNDKVLVGATLNLHGQSNSFKGQLSLGNHPNKRLQADWNEFGSDSFVFEVLDELTATEGAGYDYKADLAFLEELWLEKIEPYGERGYNAKKKGKEEKLREIAERRIANQRES
jgi:hypothetical protein